MKKSTYRILQKIPVVNLVVFALGYKELMFCTPMLFDESTKLIMEYAKKHPDVLITEKLGSEILKGNIK